MIVDRSFRFSIVASLVLVSITFGLDISFDVLRKKRALVVGGSGRVGGSVVTQLVSHGCKVVVGGTSETNFQQSRARWIKSFPSLLHDLMEVEFALVHRDRTDEVLDTLTATPCDIVIHTAGPFQGKVLEKNGVLDACVRLSLPYLDVCDDYCTASAAKTTYASTSLSPCIISTGCWPGVSSLMAKQLVEKVLQTYPELSPGDLSVDFSFFTAGSGGAGVTLLVATFLILAEKALTIQKGRRKPVAAMKEYSRVNFGSIVKDRSVAHLNLLEAASVHDHLGVGSVQCLFGTAPGFWNTLLGLMANLPPSILANEVLMRRLSEFSMPIVRLVDSVAGATNAMRCDVRVDAKPSVRATAIYGHQNLEPCVGECVVAFACAVLSGAVAPGVWFPEEAISGGIAAAQVLRCASIGAHTTLVESCDIHISREEVWG